MGGLKVQNAGEIDLVCKRDIDVKMVRCPLCGSTMRKQGEIQQPSLFSSKKRKLVSIYYCNRCGYKLLG